MKKGGPGRQRNSKETDGDFDNLDEAEEEATQEDQQTAYIDPNSLKNRQLDLKHSFARQHLNLIMFNQFDRCACFQLDPNRKDQSQIQSEAQHANYIWIKFQEDFDAKELSASTISELFAKFGDFHVLKDTH